MAKRKSAVATMDERHEGNGATSVPTQRNERLTEKAIHDPAKPRVFVVPRPNMVAVEADLVGVEPGVLLHPFDEKAEKQILASMQKLTARTVRADKDPEKDYREALASVRVPKTEDQFWINVLAFKKAMCRGAKGVDRLQMTEFRAGVFVQPDGVIRQTPVAHLTGAPERHSCRAAVKGKPDYRTRVLLPWWTYTLRYVVTTTILSVEQSLMCLVNAGVGTGVGDWRPEKDGVHGRWSVAECRVRDVKQGATDGTE